MPVRRILLREAELNPHRRGEGQPNAENLLTDNRAELPTLEQEPLSQEENNLIDRWIATEKSSRAHAAKYGRESLGMLARRTLASAQNHELVARARGLEWWEAAAVKDRTLYGL